MAEPDQEAKNGDEIVRKINKGLNAREIDFSVSACKKIPIERLAPGATLLLSQSIVAEIFRETGIPEGQANMCWDAMVTKMMLVELLQVERLDQMGTWTVFRNKLKQLRSMHAKTKKPVCLAAPDLALIIAAFSFRKIKPDELEFKANRELFIELFGSLNVMRWLPVAMKAFAISRNKPLVIEQDQEVEEPLVHPKRVKGKLMAIATAKKPPKNVYEALVQEFVQKMVIAGSESDHCDQPRTSIEKAESDTTPLDLIQPKAPKQSLEPESQQDQDLESQQDQIPNSETLRDHARQMKQFGKRLASPDQAFFRRVRRDMRHFANLSDEKEKEMALELEAIRSTVSSSSEYARQTNDGFDIFGRYKRLWKSSLEENGCISDSLRELVHHDCNANQLFYLEEIETDFQAMNATTLDGNEE